MYFFLLKICFLVNTKSVVLQSVALNSVLSDMIIIITGSILLACDCYIFVFLFFKLPLCHFI